MLNRFIFILFFTLTTLSFSVWGETSKLTTDQKLRTALSKAIQAKDLDQVQKLIAEGAPLNIPTESEVNDGTPSLSHNQLLRDAVFAGSYPILQYLLDHGAELETELPYDPETGMSVSNILIDAIRSDSPDALAMVNVLLQAGVDPNLIGDGDNADDGIPLLNAVGKQHEIVQALLNYHADPNVSSHYHDRALVNAINMEDLKAVRLLLDAGADVSLPNRCSLTLTPQTCHSYQPILPLDYVQERSDEVFVQIKTLLVQAGARSMKDFCQEAGL